MLLLLIKIWCLNVLESMYWMLDGWEQGDEDK